MNYSEANGLPENSGGASNGGDENRKGSFKNEPASQPPGKNRKAEKQAAPGPIVDKYAQSGNSWRLLIFGILFVIVAGLLAWFGSGRIGEPVFLAVLGGLAGVGVLFLFLLVLGFVQLAVDRRSDEFSRNLVNGMDSGVIVTDAESGIVYANRAYGELTGVTSETEIASVETVFSGNRQASETIYRLARLAREGQSASEELRINAGLPISEDGVRWFRIRARPMAHTDHPDGLTVWQVSDVTSDRQAQETAFQELQQAIHYLDHAPAGFFSSDRDGAIVYLNSTLADWLGIDLAMFKPGGLHLSDFVSENGLALIEAIKPDNGQPKTAVIDVDFSRGDGARIPVRLYHKLTVTSDGAPGSARTLVINRLGKEEADSDLLDAELRFSRFFNNTPIAIAGINANGSTVRTNATFLRMFKQALGERSRDQGIELSGLVSEPDRAEVDAAIAAAAAGNTETGMVNATMAGASDRFLRLFFSPVHDESEGDDEVEERVIVYVLETTEQRKLEEQFAQGQKMQAVGQLAGGVAHDFNNVLTAIIGFSELLLANHRPSDPSFGDIMNIKQNANRAASLVRQLLAFSRRQTLRPQVLQLGEVLSDVRMLLDRLLGEKVNLNVIHGRDLWPVKADISQLEQVVVNLAVNARDAMPDGGALTIKTSNVPVDSIQTEYPYNGLVADDYVLLEVSDEGTGMSEEVMEKIFEPFFSTKDVGKGTGLGLSTVYGIIKQTGGYIYPRSKVGEGTTFMVFLPRHIPVEEDQEPSQEKPAGEPARDLTGNATILLVEDEDAVRAFGSRALSSRGYTVHEAASGAEALELIEEYEDEIDLIVSDVVMPEMDGPTLLQEVRKTYPDLKFIFVSGYAEEAFAKNLPESERDNFGFLPKPFSLKELVSTVKEMLEK